MFCKHCRNLMKRVMRFENGNSYELYRCPKCYAEIKPKHFFFKKEETSKRNTVMNKSKILVKKPTNKPIKKTNKKRRGR